MVFARIARNSAAFHEVHAYLLSAKHFLYNYICDFHKYLAAFTVAFFIQYESYEMYKTYAIYALAPPTK